MSGQWLEAVNMYLWKESWRCLSYPIMQAVKSRRVEGWICRAAPSKETQGSDISFLRTPWTWWTLDWRVEEAGSSLPMMGVITVSIWCGLNKNCPPQAHVYTLGPQMVALFGKVLEPLGGGASLEEEGCRGGGWLLRLHSYALLSAQSFLSTCGYRVTSQLPEPEAMPSPPWWTDSFWNCEPK